MPTGTIASVTGAMYLRGGPEDESGRMPARFRNRNVGEWDCDELPKPPAWMSGARCADPQYTHLNFFPGDQPGRPTNLSIARCKSVCAGCRVWPECLDDAMASEDLDTTVGIRGGLTARERLSIRRTLNERRPKVPTVVYFARRLDRIKIGFSHDVEGRMKALHCTLLATVPGGRAEEAEMHQRFASGRDTGEWFRPTEELLAFIAGLRDAAEVAA